MMDTPQTTDWNTPAITIYSIAILGWLSGFVWGAYAMQHGWLG